MADKWAGQVAVDPLRADPIFKVPFEQAIDLVRGRRAAVVKASSTPGDHV